MVNPAAFQISFKHSRPLISDLIARPLTFKVCEDISHFILDRDFDALDFLVLCRKTTLVSGSRFTVRAVVGFNIEGRTVHSGSPFGFCDPMNHRRNFYEGKIRVNKRINWGTGETEQLRTRANDNGPYRPVNAPKF